MKNTLTTIALLISLNGCENSKPNGKDEIVKVDGEYLKIVVIDSCEYIQSQTAYQYFIYTHKGNCSNPIHKTFIHQ